MLQRVLLYQWLEDSLKSGEKQSEDMYILKVDPPDDNTPDKSLGPKPVEGSISGDDKGFQNKKIKSSAEDAAIVNLENSEDRRENALCSSPSTASSHDNSIGGLNYANTRPQTPDAENEAVRSRSILYEQINKLVL